MKGTKKSFILYLYLALTLVIVTLFPNSSLAAETDILDLGAQSAILVDGKTGLVLYEKEADIALPTASMTKMMTEYLVLEAVNDGKISWDQETGISDYVYQISQNRALSNVPLRSDFKYNVKELYESMAIYSANGSTIALAELIAGSETNFVKMMNEKGKELGLENFKFVNTTGLNNKDLLGQHPEGTGADEENLMSARDTAKLAYHLLNDYPEVLDTASIPKAVFRDGTPDRTEMPNWNWMLPTLVYGYEGVDGLKTGSTDLAGFCFTGTAERNGTRLIAVVMKTADYESRFGETKKLFDYGFSNYEVQEVLAAGYQPSEQSVLPVVKGKEKEVEIESTNALSLLIKRGEQEMYKPLVIMDEELLTEEGALTAPIEKGMKVGSVTVEYTGEGKLSFLTSNGHDLITTELVTTSDIEKSNGFVLFMQAIGGFFGELWTSAANGIKGLF
ncbi:D-alanyl-D-alanine carboxypeptidase (penicillin-binding protein 5/6) [Bacillus mesophilus]|uniref:serine-type D-Ala-D-Ala carboxypeptidase n=1 Tax=Bacillus mesophilus TaxID=1808955 RepID=A0A6M0QCZ6_9BACI|nr:D-alanyl-D-alanine carboxypeptidase (penicillin-binding protein 5/6) [Bacillus mesophilus]NEY74232.1 D-alanyl-D-alanine carboxypeptidase [Bacillus mesophilus]